MGSSGYRYQDATSITDYTVVSGSFLEYEVFWEAPNIKCAVDLTFSDGSNIRDAGINDQNGVNCHPDTILAAADGAWYYRKISLASRVGRTIVNYDFACEMDNAGHKFAKFRNVLITDGAGTTRKDIWQNGDALPTFGAHLTSGSPSFSAALVADAYSPATIAATGSLPTPGEYNTRVASPIDLTIRLPTPRSTFPLIGVDLSMGVLIQDPDLGIDHPVTFTRLWNGGPGDAYFHAYNEQSLFPEQMRTMGVLIQDPDLEIGHDFLYTRQWNGIGGLAYIPSFPQLERKQTTWPHAT